MDLDQIEQELEDAVASARAALDTVEAVRYAEGQDARDAAAGMHEAADRLNGPVPLSSLADALHSEARRLTGGDVA